MKLYMSERAPNPRRVRLYLNARGIVVDEINLDLQTGEHLQPAYLAINPRGTVPYLLLDDGRGVGESASIIRYFEALYPDPPRLLGETPEDIAVIDCWDRRMELEGMQSVMLAFRNSHPAFVNRAVSDAQVHMAQCQEVADYGRKRTEAWLDMLESRLAESPWVAGDAFSVADITAFVCIDFAKWAQIRAGDARPHVNAFHDRMAEKTTA